MEMSLLQGGVGQWADETFDHTGAGIAAHCLKEAVELCLACEHEPLTIIAIVLDQLRKDKKVGGRSFIEEAADVTILMLAFAHHQHFLLDKAIENKMEINRQREWGEKGAFGISEHV